LYFFGGQGQCVDPDPHMSTLTLVLDPNPDPYRIQKGENDPQKNGKSLEVSCFEVREIFS
jgi:hypothetical protein